MMVEHRQLALKENSALMPVIKWEEDMQSLKAHVSNKLRTRDVIETIGH